MRHVRWDPGGGARREGHDMNDGQRHEGHEVCQRCHDAEYLFRCPRCYRVTHWTDGMIDPPEMWCQICNHEFDPLPHQVRPRNAGTS